MFFALPAITSLIDGLGYIRCTLNLEVIAKAGLSLNNSELTEAVFPQSMPYASRPQIISEVVAPAPIALQTETHSII
ncbi:hypothetical protein PsW64_04425 [Pseudovibrio sp. W64]|nr:hypothetical protein PsW64_04425 [Pseudovibrio sp. W64]